MCTVLAKLKSNSLEPQSLGLWQVNEIIEQSPLMSKKMTNLLCNCNPNTIELLGLRMEDYLILTEEGKLLVDNAEYFLSKNRDLNNYEMCINI